MTEGACWIFFSLFRREWGNIFPCPREQAQKLSHIPAVPLKKCASTNKEHVLRLRHLQKCSTLIIRQDITLAIFTPLINDDDWFQNPSACLEKSFQHRYLVRSQNRDILHSVLGGLADRISQPCCWNVHLSRHTERMWTKWRKVLTRAAVAHAGAQKVLLWKVIRS